ncbi:MAG: PHP domain-containing protein [Limnochordales bacterium]|nr:MAG: hypothetical protein DIU83_02725 [Bacillota bacterium]
MRIDLHVHSTASDGTLSPSEVVREAHARGLCAIALTDHDTMDGVAEALQAGMRLGVEVIPGVELNTESPAGEVHVLGYFPPPEGWSPEADPAGHGAGVVGAVIDREFYDLLASRRDSRAERARKMVQRLRELGMPLSYEDVLRQAGDAPVGRPHIARALLEAGYVESVKEAFDRWLHRGGPAYVPREKLSPAEAVQAIIDAGGVPVLAHPGRIDGQWVIQELIDAGLEGLECYYPEHTPEQTERYLGLAREHGLVVTGGTDYHGPRSPHDADLGSLPVPPEAVEQLKERVRAVRRRGRRQA